MANPLFASLKLKGSSSGIIEFLMQAVGGTFNWNLPVTAGDAGQVLVSGGGAAAPMTWEDRWKIQAASGVRIPHTGTAAKTALATISIPGGAIGANGMMRIGSLWSYPNSGNNKTLAYEFGGTPLLQIVTSTTLVYSEQRVLFNRNAQNSQVLVPTAQGSGGFGASGGALNTPAVDTSGALNLIFYATLANTGETINLEGYLVELYHKT